MTDKTREADLQMLRMLWDKAGPAERILIENCADKIVHEDKYVKMMREKLSWATRNREMDEIKDIHDIVAGNIKYRNL